MNSWATRILLAAASAAVGGCTSDAATDVGSSAAALTAANVVERYNAAVPATCDPAHPNRCGGTEVNAFEDFQGSLFMGLGNWLEQFTPPYPDRNAQVLRFDGAHGWWTPTADLAFSCPATGAPVAAPWEQVNDLQAVVATDPGGVQVRALLAATTPIAPAAGAACAPYPGTVYVGDGTSWDPLPNAAAPHGPHLGEILAGYYNADPDNYSAEVRYLTVSTTVPGCTPSDPCVFAAVSTVTGPNAAPPALPTACNAPHFEATVWRAEAHAVGGHVSLHWHDQPEVAFDGCNHPFAARIVSLVADDDGRVLVGTSVFDVYKQAAQQGIPVQNLPGCVVPGSFFCPRPAVYELDLAGAWNLRWRGRAPAQPDPETEVRGIATVGLAANRTTWILTHPGGRVWRHDPGANSFTADAAAPLGTLSPCNNNGKFYGYQILRMRFPNNRSVLVVAAQHCRAPTAPPAAPGYAVGFFRAVDELHPSANQGPMTQWQTLEFPTITDDPAGTTTVLREDSLRWLHVPAGRPCDLAIGTTDMNQQAGTRTARAFHAINPFNQPGCAP